MKQFLFVMAFLALQSCGKSDNEGGSISTSGGVTTTAPDGSSGTVSQSGSTYSMTQQIQGSANYYFVNYQFKDGKCDTDLHRFSGPGREVVLAQLCSGLGNEWMNHSCAQGARRAYYAQMCN
jgi:hypothetical protein